MLWLTVQRLKCLHVLRAEWLGVLMLFYEYFIKFWKYRPPLAAWQHHQVVTSSGSLSLKNKKNQDLVTLCLKQATTKNCQLGKKNKLNLKWKQVYFSYPLADGFVLSVKSLHFNTFFRKQDMLNYVFCFSINCIFKNVYLKKETKMDWGGKLVFEVLGLHRGKYLQSMSLWV